MTKIPLGHIRKYRYIDALRGIAVMGVVMSHVGFCAGCVSPSLAEGIQLYATRGVLLFFIVSALTLFLSMEARSKVEEHNNLHFFIRRFFRIAPMFYVAVLLYLFFAIYTNRGTEICMADIISSVSFISWINPHWFSTVVPAGWTISVEMTFYLLIPYLFKKIKSLAAALWITLVTSLVIQFVRMYMFHFSLISDHTLWKQWLVYFFPTHFPIFLLGIVLYFLIKTRNEINIERNNSLIISFLMFAGIALMSGVTFSNILSENFVFSIGLVLFCFALSQKPISFFVNRVTIFMGKISFSVYLAHSAVIQLMQKVGLVNMWTDKPLLNYIFKIIIALVLSAVVASITYKLIEQPGQKMGKKLIIWIEKRKMRGAEKSSGANLSEVGP